MVKKLSLILAAAAVLAFAAPALANAATGLTETVGTLVPTGKIITLSNVGGALVRSAKTGNISCASGVLMAEGKLNVNTATEIKIEEGGNLFSSSCKNATSGTATVKNLKLVSLKTTGGGSGTISESFEIELAPMGITCKYTGTNQSFAYNPTETTAGGRIVSVNDQPLTVTPAACGSVAELEATFITETQNTLTAVYLM